MNTVNVIDNTVTTEVSEAVAGGEVITINTVADVVPTEVAIDITIQEEPCDCQEPCENCNCNPEVPDNTAPANDEPYWEKQFLPISMNVTDKKKELPQTIRNFRERYLDNRSDEDAVQKARDAHFRATLANSYNLGIIEIIIGDQSIRDYVADQAKQLEKKLAKLPTVEAKEAEIARVHFMLNQFLVLLYMPELAEFYRIGTDPNEGDKIINMAMSSYMTACVNTVNEYINRSFGENKFSIVGYIGTELMGAMMDQMKLKQLFDGIERLCGTETGPKVRGEVERRIRTIAMNNSDRYLSAGFLTFGTMADVKSGVARYYAERSNSLTKELIDSGWGFGSVKHATKKK